MRRTKTRRACLKCKSIKGKEDVIGTTEVEIETNALPSTTITETEEDVYR